MFNARRWALAFAGVFAGVCVIGAALWFAAARDFGRAGRDEDIRFSLRELIGHLYFHRGETQGHFLVPLKASAFGSGNHAESLAMTANGSLKPGGYDFSTFKVGPKLWFMVAEAEGRSRVLCIGVLCGQFLDYRSPLPCAGEGQGGGYTVIH